MTVSRHYIDPTFDFIRWTKGLKDKVQHRVSTSFKMFRYLKPGGYIEVHDISYYHSKGSAIWDAVPNMLSDYGTTNGRLFGKGQDIKIAMRASSFVEIQETKRCSLVSPTDDTGRYIVDSLIQNVGGPAPTAEPGPRI